MLLSPSHVPRRFMLCPVGCLAASTTRRLNEVIQAKVAHPRISFHKQKRQSSHIGLKRPCIRYVKSQMLSIPSLRACDILCNACNSVLHLCECFAFSPQGHFPASPPAHSSRIRGSIPLICAARYAAATSTRTERRLQTAENHEMHLKISKSLKPLI